jgi:serine/threonine protein kinase/predicted ATPase
MPADAPQIELRGEIGAGATGRVSRGVLLAPFGGWPAGTEVAVKRLHERLLGDPRARLAFLAEAEIGAQLIHPGLVRQLYAGEDERGPYLVLQFVPGETLRVVLAAHGPLPEPLLRSVACQVAAGLADLHAAGFVHGDVKPENMRLDAQGRAVLLDLGFARLAPELAPAPAPAPAANAAIESVVRAGNASPHAPPANINPGSLAYLAPERARGEPGDRSSDVFSLGIALYELASGLHPFASRVADPPAGGARIGLETGTSSGPLLARSIEAPGADRLLAALATARYVPPSRHVPQISPFLDHLLQEMLRRDPLARPGSRDVAQRFVEQELGAWWREQIDFGSGSPRGVMGAPGATHLTPLVGRERELERLLARYNETAGAGARATAREPRGLSRDPAAAQPSAKTARGGCIWLTGPAGSGKSRLMSDFAARVRASDAPPLYLYGRCASQEEERPCAPILRLLLRWLRIPPNDAALGPRERAMLERIAPPKEASTLAQALDPRAKGATETSVVAALARWLVALARQAPLVVFLDDVHEADEGTLQVLARASEELASTRLLLVLGRRDDEPPLEGELLAQLERRLDQGGLAERIALAPLDQPAVLELVMRLFHHSAPRLRIAQVLWSRSRGNPGLLAEILRGLIDRGEAHPHGGTRGEGGQLVLAISPERLPLPDSLSTLINERYQKLEAEDRRWLQRLAVVGGRISAQFLRRAFAPVSEGELDALFVRLVQTGWLVPAGDRYRFARPALREGVYRAIPPDSRARLHAAAARALAPRTSASLSIADAFQRAFHLRAAGDPAALLRVLRPLLAVLIRRGQTHRVDALARWGLEALDALPATRARARLRIEFLEAAADAADRLGNRAQQRRWLDHLSDLELSPSSDAASLARVYLLHGRYAVSTGQYGLARGFLRNAVELAESSRARGLSSEALRRLSAVQAHVGELAEARKLAQAALESAEHDPQRAVAHIQAGVIELLEDELEPALRAVDRALALLRKTSDWTLPGVFAAAHMLRGRIYRLLGRPERALGAMQHAVRQARQAGERRLEMEATARMGGLLLDINRAEEAEARLRDALLIANEIEDRRGQTLATLWLGILLWEQSESSDRRQEAANLLARAGTLAREMGLARAEALALAVQARIDREAGRAAAALEKSEKALQLLDLHGAELADRIVITGTHALVLHAQDERRATDLIKRLRRRLRQENRRLQNPLLRKSQRDATTNLLAAVLSPDGVIYPRVAGA